MDDKTRNVILGLKEHRELILEMASMIKASSIAFDVDEDEILNEINVAIKGFLIQMKENGVDDSLIEKKKLCTELFEKLFK